MGIHAQFTYVSKLRLHTINALIDCCKGGEFTEFALAGANGIFTGFTTEFVAQAWDLEGDEVKELVGSQKSTGIIKVKDGFKMPELNDEDRKGMALNCLEAPLDVDIKNGGRVVVLNTKNLPLVDLVRIDVTTPNLIFCHLAGRRSVWKALNPQVLEASFNVAPETEKHSVPRGLTLHQTKKNEDFPSSPTIFL
ncbi:hypothetical protein MKW92_019828 [Papaver armeniacum]|nr:hypothetical protein MKW92_019828 [Papaver armeniacum]